MSSFIRRSLGATTGLLAATALVAVGAGTVGAKTSTKGKSASGTVYAATTHNVGGLLGTQYIAGQDTDSVHGAGAITYTIKVASIPTKPGKFKLTAKPVTTWFATGSLTGTAGAQLTVGANSAVTVTGTIKETKGTGALKGHTFSGTFKGSGSLTTSQYKFTYKGTYK